MIVFDVDGTLIGGEKTDWKCFDDAFAEAAGFGLTPEFFYSIKEVTAQAIVHQALDGASLREKQIVEAKTLRGYLDRLETVVQDDSDAFPAMEGAVDLLNDLKSRKVPIAIATGDWRESSVLKLNAAGIPFRGIPMTTSSEHYSRADIIASAVKKTRGNLLNCIYIGDGHWDLLATRRLGISFIGCGTKLERLEQYGARFLLHCLDIDEFWRTIERMGLSIGENRF